ncbi:hypothetical protein Tcan_01956 [Toxocara canis]|uniref:Uncharacterized protein n=1 Tax=Toxocara canis TaxID=6265 RepID=A0A0B2VC55_TOXCA|nr:hypothetical protein Tcan_01956 [Toxocara canis]
MSSCLYGDLLKRFPLRLKTNRYFYCLPPRPWIFFHLFSLTSHFFSSFQPVVIFFCRLARTVLDILFMRAKKNCRYEKYSTSIVLFGPKYLVQYRAKFQPPSKVQSGALVEHSSGVVGNRVYFSDEDEQDELLDC